MNKEFIKKYNKFIERLSKEFTPSNEQEKECSLSTLIGYLTFAIELNYINLKEFTKIVNKIAKIARSNNLTILDARIE